MTTELNPPWELAGGSPDGMICRCRDCGLKITTTVLPIHHRCRVLTQKMARPPSLVTRLFNFGKAGARLATAAIKRKALWCTQEQIDARLTVCRACPLFNGKVCTHKNCGCSVNREETFFNKLAWATERCPDTPPRWGPTKG